MADDPAPAPAPPPTPALAPGDCLACRGGGQVVSHLGGEARLVPCPWCEGSGLRLAGHDAQARWREAPAAGPGLGALVPAPGPPQAATV